MCETECKHYEREEYDIFLQLTRQMRKFVRCKKCKADLYEVEVLEGGQRKIIGELNV